MRLTYAALSDVGRVRRDNQDSGYAGPHLLVIADGVGGSARGDIASAATVEVLRRLDEQPVDGSPDTMLTALAGAIHRSHDRIAALVRESPEIEGTSTTVTAVLFDGARIGVGHVGDSRGYLLRDGSLSQLTTDHTFVQSLIDEGRITEDEARVHPHRNLILRAVDGVHEPEPDVFTLDLAPGDRILLCSDGCSGVLSDDQLATLLAEDTAEHASVALVRAALDAGSSDNVTVVVADVVADQAEGGAGPGQAETAPGATPAPLVVGAAAVPPRRRGAGRATRVRDTGELEPVPGDGDDLGADGDAGDLDPEEQRYAPRPPRRFTWARRLTALAVVVLVVALIGGATYAWSQSQYYVADHGEHVAIFRGVEADLPPISTHHVEETSGVRLDALPDYNARQVRDGIDASSLADARGIVSRLQRLAQCTQPTPSPAATPSASPTRKPAASPTKGVNPKKRKPTRPTASATTRQQAIPNPSPSPSPSSTAVPCTETP